VGGSVALSLPQGTFQPERKGKSQEFGRTCSGGELLGVLLVHGLVMAVSLSKTETFPSW